MSIKRKNKIQPHSFQQPNRLHYLVIGLLLLLSIIYVTSFSVLKICKFNNFDPSCYQVGWISHASWKFFTEGRFAVSHIVQSRISIPAFSIMTSLFLCFFLPPYPKILLILHTVLITIAIFPLYLLTKQRLKSHILALTFSVSYLLHPLVHFGTMSGFTPEMIILPSALFAFYYFEKGIFKKSRVFVIFANLGRISIVLMNMLWGFCLIILKKKKYGKNIFSISLIWLLTIAICLFLLKIGDIFSIVLRIEAYGDTFWIAIQTILKNPLILAQNLFTRENLIIFLGIFTPLAFMPLLRPLFLLPVIVSLGYIFFFNNDTAELCFVLPFVYLSAIYGAEKFINLTKYKNRLKHILVGSILILSIISHYSLHPPWQATRGPIPLSKEFNYSYYKITEHNKIGHRFLKLIPRTSSVIAQYPLDQHLTHRKKLNLFNRRFENEDWEYVFLDISVPHDFNYQRKVKNLLEGNIYGVLSYEDGWLLLKKNYSREKNQEVLLLVERYFQKHPIILQNNQEKGELRGE